MDTSTLALTMGPPPDLRELVEGAARICQGGKAELPFLFQCHDGTGEAVIIQRPLTNLRQLTILSRDSFKVISQQLLPQGHS